MVIKLKYITIPIGDAEFEDDPCGIEGPALGGGTPILKSALAD